MAKTSKKTITVFFSKTGAPEKEFKNRAEAKSWIMEGMMSTEGAERDHYVSLLKQLMFKKVRLDYDIV